MRPKIHTFQSEVLDIIDLTPTVKHFTLSVPEGFRFEAGQFVSAAIPLADDTGGGIKRTPYSIASGPALKDRIELVIKLVPGGIATEYFWKLSKGDHVPLVGPMGRFKVKNPEKNIIFIATGTGIGPFRSMIHDLLDSGAKQDLHLIAGTRHEDEILYKDEFEKLAENYKNFHYHPTVSQPRENTYTCERGRVQASLERHMPAGFTGDFYLCGLWAMIDSMHKLLQERGMPKENIHFERYD